MLAYWPVAVMVSVLTILVVSRMRGYVRPPLIVVEQPVQRDHQTEILILADVVHAGAFYASGRLPDWDLCHEFAAKIITENTAKHFLDEH